jgi:hypothetical protein
MRIHEIIALCNQYGENTTLAEIRQSIQGKKKHLCPKCKGTGSITIEYNGYPSGLPDSGWVYEPAYREEECDLCKGEGYTGKLMKPHMVQDGWE